MKCQDRNFIRSFIKILHSVGGVMDERTYLDLINETTTEMSLDQVEVAELLSMRVDLEEKGHLKRAVETETELWLLTLEGLKFAELVP